MHMKAQVPAYSSPDIDAQVDALMSTMTMEEKLAQIVGTRLDAIMLDGKVSLEKCRERSFPRQRSFDAP